MGRTARIFMDYSCYHVITRGNQKQKLFLDIKDREKYLAILKKAKRKYSISLYSYCLMSNHVHLLIQLENSRNISLFMKWLNQGYTIYFNSRYDKVGHLWQGRFKSKPIVKGPYLIHCSNYIEANPVRAKLADDIAAYAWSSYKERCLLQNKNLLDEIQFINN